MFTVRACISHLASQNSSYEIQKIILPTIAQLVKNPPAVQETPVRFLGWEDPLEKGKATHSSILAWRNPWTVHGVTKSGTRLKDLHFQVMVYVIRFSLRKTKNHVNHVIYIFNREKYKLPVLCTHTYLTSLEW